MPLNSCCIAGKKKNKTANSTITSRDLETKNVIQLLNNDDVVLYRVRQINIGPNERAKITFKRFTM